MINSAMKKVFSILATVFLFIFSAQAQYDYNNKVQFGFDLGLGTSNQWGNAYDAYGKKGTIAFQFGFSLDVNFAPCAFMETGISFNKKGCRIYGHEWLENGGPLRLYDNERAIANLFYIEVPAMIGFRIPIEYEVAWKILVGPYFGIGVAGERKYWFKSPENAKRDMLISSFSENYESRFKRFDVGVKAGTGIEFRRVTLLFVYELGMFNNYHNDIYHTLNARNSTIMGVVGFRF